MESIAVLIAAAAVGHVVSRFLRLPSIPMLLLAGWTLSFFAPVPASLLEDGLVLGASFLLFISGIELNPGRMRAQRAAALRVGAGQFLAMAVVGFCTAVVLDYPTVEAGYIALGITGSSTLIGVRLLQRNRQMFEPFGRLVLGVLLFQDVLVLAALPLVAVPAGNWTGVARTAGGLVFLGALSLGARRWIAPSIARVADDDELVLLGALAVLFLFLGLTSSLGLPLVVGAFLAGVALSRFPTDGITRSRLAPLGDFFTAVFFTALGALVRVPNWTSLSHALVLIAVVILLTTPMAAVIAERAGLSARSAIEAGLLLSQTSELALVIGLFGMLEGHIGQEVFNILALVTLVTMLVTPFLATDRMARRLMKLHPSRRTQPHPPPSGHVLLLGAGSTGGPLIEDLLLTENVVVVVDEDPVVLASLAEAGILTFRGDASDAQVLRQAGAAEARVVISTVRRARDNAPLLELAPGVPKLIRVFDQNDEAWVRERGGTPILFSEATAQGLLEWCEEEKDALSLSVAARTGRGPAAGARRFVRGLPRS